MDASKDAWSKKRIANIDAKMIVTLVLHVMSHHAKLKWDITASVKTDMFLQFVIL